MSGQYCLWTFSRGSGICGYVMAKGTGKSDADFIDLTGIDEPEDELEQAIASVGSSADAYVRIYKLEQPTSGKAGWERIGNVPVTQLDPDAVAAEYGGGRYLFAFVNGENGQIIKRKYETWAKRPTLPKGAGPSQLTGAGVGGNTENLLFTMVSNQLAEERKLNHQLMLEMAKNNNGGSNITELVGALSSLKNLTQDDNSKTNPVESMKDMFDLFGEFKNLIPSGEGGSFMERIAPKLMDVLDKALTKPAAASPGGAQHNTKELAASASPGLPADLGMLAKKYAPLILTEARSGRSPYDWGHFVAQRVSASLAPVLLRLASANEADRMRFITEVEPALMDHTAWLTQACEGMLDVLDPQPQGEPAGDGSNDAEGNLDPNLPATEGAGGDLAHGSTHAPGGANGNPAPGSPGTGNTE